MVRKGVAFFTPVAALILSASPTMNDRVPKKELASYLNLSAETLSRLKHSGKI
jgi:DNA-binding Xre family transcriptional regulator